MADGLFEVHEFAAREDGLVEIHAFPYRKYTHPEYGELEFTEQDAMEIKENFDNKVLEHDVAWDYAHKKDISKGDKAAGWVEAVEVRNDGAWVLMKPTETARNEIEKGEWKYSSMTRLPEWTNNATGKTFKNVLYGGALTNHPFLKGVAPLNFSDFDITYNDPTTQKFDDSKEDSVVDIKELAVKVGLPEDASQEDIDKQIQLFADNTKALDEAKAKLAEADNDKDEPKDIQEFGDLPQDVKDELIAGRELRLKVEAQEFSESIPAVDEKHVIAPAYKEKARDAYLALKKGEMEIHEFAATMSEVNAKGQVELGERGTAHDDIDRDKENQTTDDAIQEFADLTLSLTQDKEHPMSWGDAQEKVAKEHPELAKAYNEKRIGGGVQ